jgi:site-specific recombinase XerD
MTTPSTSAITKAEAPSDIIVSPRIAELLSEASASVAQHLFADNTKKAYASDWRVFQDWCDEYKVASLPAHPTTLIAFFTDIKHQKAMATLSRYLVSIKAAHTAAGHESPTQHPSFATAWKGMRREKAARQDGAAALGIEDLLACIDAQSNTLTGKRNRALLATGYLGGFRRSELVRIRVQDLSFVQQGVVILLPKSKTDQEGHGKEKAFPYMEDPRLCVPTLIREWMKACSIKDGFLWRARRGGRWTDQHITDSAFAKILKSTMVSVGLDPHLYSAHSLRSGIATHLAGEGVDIHAIQEHLGHASSKMTQRYVRQTNLWKNNPLHRISTAKNTP